MKVIRSVLKYYGTELCELSCPGCYLKTLENNAIVEPPAKLLSSLVIEPHFYFNKVEPIKKTFDKHWNSFLIHLTDIHCKSNATFDPKVMFTDITTASVIGIETLKTKLSSSDTLVLSLKKRPRGNLEESFMNEIQSNFKLGFIFTEGMDSKHAFEYMIHWQRNINAQIMYQVKKPYVITPDTLTHMLAIKERYPFIKLDICITKAFDNYDCSKEQKDDSIPIESHSKYPYIFTFIENKGYYNCAYASNKCLVTPPTLS
jgi:hypothetical protein